MNNVDAIIVSDLHAREDTPEARTDDYFEAFKRKIEWLRDLQVLHSCPVLCGGDLLNTAKVSPYLERWLIKNLPEMITVPGQHELPNHNMKEYNKSSLSVLETSDRITVLKDRNDLNVWDEYKFHVAGLPYGQTKITASPNATWPQVLIMHKLCWKKRQPFPGVPNTGKAINILQKYEDFDLIITGDNHQPFHLYYLDRYNNKRLLVNPGSMMRITAEQKDHKPRVYLWNAIRNEVEIKYFPIEKNVISRKHIVGKSKGEQMEALVKTLKEDVEMGMSFKDNLETYFNRYNTPETIKNIIREVAID